MGTTSRRQLPSLPPHLRVLSCIGMGESLPALEDMHLPATLREMSFDFLGWAPFRTSTPFPSGLLSLDLGEGFGERIDLVDFPPTLVSLKFGVLFQQPATSLRVPLSLRVLWLGSADLRGWRVPEHLQELCVANTEQLVMRLSDSKVQPYVARAGVLMTWASLPVRLRRLALCHPAVLAGSIEYHNFVVETDPHHPDEEEEEEEPPHQERAVAQQYAAWLDGIADRHPDLSYGFFQERPWERHRSSPLVWHASSAEAALSLPADVFVRDEETYDGY